MIPYVLKDIHAPLSVTGAYFLCHWTTLTQTYYILLKTHFTQYSQFQPLGQGVNTQTPLINQASSLTEQKNIPQPHIGEGITSC